jgi:cell division topological specificity factor
MSLLSFLLGQQKKPSANVAKERLQIILAHERSGRYRSPEYLPQLQKELIMVISKYIAINPDDIKVHLERQDTLEILEVKIEMPQH